jgi:transcriptional regulator of acetoin/glycerol metabolism
MKTKPPSEPEALSLREIKKAAILAAVEQLDGNIPLAAEKLEMGQTTLYRKLKEYGMAKQRGRTGKKTRRASRTAPRAR